MLCDEQFCYQGCAFLKEPFYESVLRRFEMAKVADFEVLDKCFS